MATLLVLYKTPTDAAAFDKYYAETHIPLAKKIPGLRSYEISKGAVASPAGATNVYLVAILSFDSVAAIQAGMGTPEGAAAGGDLANFATGGADLMIFEDGPA
ncbi:MAG TPA: EthD family reductase [Roseiarcus sp.]|nr:EthD family reductase [Roseiarcus sp.]